MSIPHSSGAADDAFVRRRAFGVTATGQSAELFILQNSLGMEVSISDFGATVVALRIPDRGGQIEDVVLGFDDVRGYEKNKAYFGSTVGRYANRIAGGSFEVDGHRYTLPKNEGENTLHGGMHGFDKKFWRSNLANGGDDSALAFSYESSDGEEGFPGKLTANVRFTLAKDRNELRIEYVATTDQPSVVNLTNHSYFNLAGQSTADILSHVLTLHASKFTPVNDKRIPTGKLLEVSGTPLDFRKPAAIGARINEPHEQLKLARGYDHNWVIDKTGDSQELILAARAHEPRTGRVLEVLTTEPGIQFYSGNFLDGAERGKAGQPYEFRTGFCLETQHFPDSPNHPDFPSTRIAPGETFHSTTVFRFSVE